MKYEYNYECLLKCPKNTHPSKNNIYKCEYGIITCPKDFPFIKKCIKDEYVKYSAEDIFNKICIISNNSLEMIQYIINLIIKDIIKVL